MSPVKQIKAIAKELIEAIIIGSEITPRGILRATMEMSQEEINLQWKFYHKYKDELRK